MTNNQQQQRPADVGDRLYTVPETGAALGIGPTKTWELIRTGRLTVVRLGRRTTRVKGSSIAALMGVEASHASA